MKTLRILMLSLLLSILSLSIWITGCGHPDNNNNNNTGEAKSSLRVVHVSYDAPAVDVLLNDKKAITELPFGSTSGYAKVNTGEPAVKVVESGKAAPILLDAKVKLEKDKAYTVFALKDGNALAGVVAEDDLKADEAKAKVRFLHASPDAPAVDIKVEKGDGTAVFENTAFKTITPYKTVDEGEYSFVVTAAGDTNPVVSYQSIKVEKGKIYTVIAKGTLDASDKFPFVVRVLIDSSEQGKASVDLTAKPAPQADKANVRVIHASYDGPAVDIALDGEVAIPGLEYGKSSGYASLDAGKRAVLVTPAGAKTPELIKAGLDLKKDTDYTVFAVGAAANIGPIVATDDRTPNNDKAKVRFLHASPDAPAVDIRVGKGDGPQVFKGIAFKTITEYSAVDEGEYSFVVTAAGDTNPVVSFKSIKVEKGKVYTVVALGTLDAKDKFDFIVRVFVDGGDGKASLDLEPIVATKAKVMVIHASPDAPAVDLYIDETKALGSLAFPKNTGYVSLDAGKRKVKVTAAGATQGVIEQELTLDANKNYSVFAINKLASIEPLLLEDDLTAPAKGKAHVRFLHLSPDAPAVDIAVKGGAALFPNKKFKDFTKFTPVDAGTYDLEVRLAGKTTVVLPLAGIKLEEGKIYTVFAKGLLSVKNGAAQLGAEIIVNNAR